MTMSFIRLLAIVSGAALFSSCNYQLFDISDKNSEGRKYMPPSISYLLTSRLSPIYCFIRAYCHMHCARNYSMTIAKLLGVEKK